MRATDIYKGGGRWLRAEDLEAGREVSATIEAVTVHELGDGKRKLAIAFVGKQRQLLLNKTNCDALSAILGDETDGWLGKRIVVFVTPVTFQGREVSGIRIKAATAAGGTVRRFA